MSLNSRASSFPLRRRDFLALSSVAAGAALLPSFASAQKELFSEPLSVGYLEGSDELVDVFRLPWQNRSQLDGEEQRVVPAESMMAGDSAMAYSMVDVKVHGLYPAMPPSHLAQSVHLTIFCHLPWLGFEKPLPFHPWGARFGSQPTCGAPNRFLVPTREDGSLEMAFDILSESKKGALPRRAVADFTVDSWSGRPKLQRGIYFLGLETKTFSRDQVLPNDPEEFRWDLCSLVLSIDHIEEGAI